MTRSLARIASLALLGLAFVAAAACAAPAALQLISSYDNSIAVGVTLSELTIQPVTTPNGAFTDLEVPEYGFTDAVGAPRLPVLRSLIEVPQGATWTVVLDNAVLREIAVTSKVSPLQPPQPKNSVQPQPFAYDPAAYARSGYSSRPLATAEEAGMLRGRRLVQLVVNAVDYDPAKGTIRVLDNATVRIVLAGADQAATEALRERYASPQFDRIVERAVLNGGQERYMPGGEIGYLVISTPALENDPDLASYLSWRWERGFRVTFVTTMMTGSTKEQIKAYIQDAYDTWAIPPTFVLLVGDTPAIPHWVGIGADNPPTDLNYTMLAGTDYLPDVALGRLSVTSSAEMQNIVAKMLSYEQVGWSGNDDWETHATFMASEDNYTISEGTHNYVIATYLDPLGYRSDRLYVHTYHATTQQVRDAFNAGRSQGTYSGHGAETYWADGPVFYQADVRALTNTVYPFIQAYTCLSNNYSVAECFGETWIRTAHAGLAYLGSSVTSYWTEDDILEKKVYQGFYDDQNPGDPVDQTWIGGMVIYGKLKFYEYFGNTSTTRRYFEMYNVMGDESIDIWTTVPRTAAVQVPAGLIAGQTSFEVTVTGFPYALIFVHKLDGVNTITDTAWTDGTGHATVNLSQPLAPGPLYLTITAHNMRPYSGQIPVIQPSGPWLVFDSFEIVDPQGDGDAQADAGETIDMELLLRNVGIDPAHAVTATLSSADPLVEISTPERPFGDIASGAVGDCIDPYVVSVSGAAPDQHVVPFTLTAQSDEGQWPGVFNVTVQAPILGAGTTLVDDSAPAGNANGGADPGETVFLWLWLGNTGHAAAHNLAGTLTCDDPAVVIHDAAASCVVVPVGGNGLLATFQVELLPSCPTPATMPFHVALSGDLGVTAAVDFLLSVGAYVDDVENDRGWTCGITGDTASSGLWVRAEPIGTTYGTPPQQVQPEEDHTPDPGAICFVTGNGTVGGAAGEQDVDGGKTTLLSPVFDLNGAVSATISYWRWYTNNLGNSPGLDYWDVDVTSNATTWVHLEHTTASANSWNQYTFNLTDYVALTGQVRVRFVADDTSPNSLVEGAVDDFTLTAVRTPATDAPDVEARGATGLVSCRPNPFNPKTSIVYAVGRSTRARIGIYDVAGRLMRTLVDGTVPAGEHTVAFDGSDEAGKALPSGIYFVRMETPEILQIKQVTLLK